MLERFTIFFQSPRWSASRRSPRNVGSDRAEISPFAGFLIYIFGGRFLDLHPFLFKDLQRRVAAKFGSNHALCQSLKSLCRVWEPAQKVSSGAVTTFSHASLSATGLDSVQFRQPGKCAGMCVISHNDYLNCRRFLGRLHLQRMLVKPSNLNVNLDLSMPKVLSRKEGQ